MNAELTHPCLTCGACCATFRVSMHWSETDPARENPVPRELTEPLDAHQLCMRGTWDRNPRCIALDADIGTYSRCTIHPQRPQACRDVPASFEFGVASDQCDRARERHGLPKLTAADWPSGMP